jgi:hypothetical protein
VTFVATCAASGEMLKPMIIYKGKTSRAISDIEYHKSEIFVTHQVKAWMDESLMLRWAKEVLLKHTKGKHCFLLLDSFHAHITEKVTKFLQKSNVSTAIIPGGCTSKVQPLDVCINNPIKDTIRGEWEAFLMETIDKAGDNEGASKTDITRWIHIANSLLDSQRKLVSKAFKVCGISNDLDGSENHLIRCTKELPEFVVPYGRAEESDEESDIFHSESDDDDSHDCDDSEADHST